MGLRERRALRRLHKAGERVLLPTVRGVDKDALILTDGFSCRSQIKEATDRRALHLAQVLQMALRDGGGPPGDYPESEYFEKLYLRLADRSAGCGVDYYVLGGQLSSPVASVSQS